MRTRREMNYFSCGLRARATPAERVLWARIQRRQVGGFRFRRQKPIGSCIVDFSCIAARVAIEVDGGYHNEPEQQTKDRRRDAFLRSRGWTVMRFTNERVVNELEAVAEEIRVALIRNTRTRAPAAEHALTPYGSNKRRVKRTK